MKNIIMTVLTFLLAILIIVAVFKGIKIGNLDVLSIGQIIERNKELNSQTEQINILNNVSYKKYLSELTDATKKLSTSKSEYLDVASISSDTEIKRANQEKTYTMEYLWSQIGNHATSEGVNLKLNVVPVGTDGDNKLDFTATGSYIGIRNFVYSLEDDEDLNFRIENFKLTMGTNDENLVGTFTVNNVPIKQEEQPTQAENTNDNSQSEGNSDLENNIGGN